MKVYDTDLPSLVWQSSCFKGDILELKVDADSIFVLTDAGVLRCLNFSPNCLENAFHTYRTPEQRFSIISQFYDAAAVNQQAELIRLKRYKGLELVCRDSAKWQIKKCLSSSSYS
jgi:hypothetical protein